MKIVSVGGITIDTFVHSAHSRVIEIREPERITSYLGFPYGSKEYLDDFLELPGGGAHNTAVSFSRLGFESLLIGCVGDDDQKKTVFNNLVKNGVSSEGLKEISGERTGMSIILNSFEGDRTLFSYRGANNHFALEKMDFSLLEGSSALYIPSLYCESSEAIKHLTSFARSDNLLVAMNPGKTQISFGLDGLSEVLKDIDILIMNVSEIEKLTGRRSKHKVIEESVFEGLDVLREPWISDVRAMVMDVLQKGVKEVVITEGIKGAQYFTHDHHYWLPSYPIDPIETLGAGDAFASTFVAMRTRGDDPLVALKYASANASKVVTQVGAQTGLSLQNDLDSFVDSFHNYAPYDFSHIK